MNRMIFVIMLSIFLSGCAHTAFEGSEMSRAFKAFDKAKKIKYEAEKYELDYWQTPTETKYLGSGDCEDQAIYLQRLLMDVGIKSYVIFGETNVGDSEFHVWNEAQICNETYVLDVTHGIFDKKEVLDVKYPNSYKLSELSFAEKEAFDINKRILHKRLINWNEKTDLLKCLKK